MKIEFVKKKNERMPFSKINVGEFFSNNRESVCLKIEEMLMQPTGAKINTVVFSEDGFNYMKVSDDSCFSLLDVGLTVYVNGEAEQ